MYNEYNVLTARVQCERREWKEYREEGLQQSEAEVRDCLRETIFSTLPSTTILHTAFY